MPTKKYFVGGIYNKLTILSKRENRDLGISRPLFLCRCSCGIEIEKRGLQIKKIGYCGIPGRHRNFEIKGDYAELQISNGYITKIDLDDLEKCRNHCWVRSGSGYAHARIGKKNVKLHKLVSGFNFADHVNRDRLDNRKINLVKSDYMHNAQNRGNNIFIEFNGYKKTIMQWSRELGINRETLRYRYHKGKHIEIMNLHCN